MYLSFSSISESTTLSPRYAEDSFRGAASQARWGRAAVGVTLPIMMVLLFLRLYTRVRITRKVGSDDYLAIIAALCNIANCATLLWLIDGLIKTNSSGDDWGFSFSMSPKCKYLYNCIYSAACIFVKCALLVHYLRIFNPSLRARVMIWIGIVIVVLCYASTGLACLGLCFLGLKEVGGSPGVKKQPAVAAIYDTTVAQGIMNIVTDFYCLIIPLYLVIPLNLPLKKKICVSFIFLTGLIPCVCSIAGAVLRFQERYEYSVWDTMPVLSLGIAELNIALICNCLTTLVVLFKDLRKRPAYLSIKRYLRGESSSDLYGESGDEKQSDQSSDKLHPDVPNPVMTGLRSFIRKAYRSQSVESTKQSTALTDLTDVSVDTAERQLKVDYHNQLKSMR